MENDTIKSNYRVQTGYSKHLRLTRKKSPMCNMFDVPKIW